MRLKVEKVEKVEVAGFSTFMSETWKRWKRWKTVHFHLYGGADSKRARVQAREKGLSYGESPWGKVTSTFPDRKDQTAPNALRAALFSLCSLNGCKDAKDTDHRQHRVRA